MNDQGQGILGHHDATPEQVREAWEYAAMRAMIAHRAADVPVTSWDWDNGCVLQVPASDFLDQQADDRSEPSYPGAQDQDPARKSA